MSSKNTVEILIKATGSASFVQQMNAIRSSLKTFHQEMEKAGSHVRGLANQITTLAGAYVSLNAVKDVGKSFMAAAGDAESFKATLEATYGSVEKATKTWDLFVETAKKNPFKQMEIAQMGVILQGFDEKIDFDKWLKPFLEFAAKVRLTQKNVTPAEIASNFGRVLGGNVAESEVARSLKLGRKLADELGVKVENLTKVSLPKYQAALLHILTTDRAFAGQTEALAKTWQGRLSNLGDMWDIFSQKVADAGVWDRMKAKLDEVLNKLYALDKDGTLDRWAKQVSESLSSGIEKLEEALKAARNFYNFLADHKYEVETIAIMTAIFMAASKLITIFGAVTKALETFGIALGIAKGASTAAAIAMNALTFGGAILAVGALVEVVLRLRDAWIDAGKWHQREADIKQESLDMDKRIEDRNKTARMSAASVKEYYGENKQPKKSAAASMFLPTGVFQDDEAKKRDFSTPGSKKQLYYDASIIARLNNPTPDVTIYEILLARKLMKELEAKLAPEDRIKANDMVWKDVSGEKVTATSGVGVGGGNQGKEKPFKFTSAGLPLKNKKVEARGKSQEGTYALAHDVYANIPGIKQFTAFNDNYGHEGKKHGLGMAFDFTIKDPKKAAADAEMIRQRAKAVGAEVTVFDEYNHPSKKSTAPHLHVELKTQQSVGQYSQFMHAKREGDLGFMAQLQEDNAAKAEEMAAQVKKQIDESVSYMNDLDKKFNDKMSAQRERGDIRTQFTQGDTALARRKAAQQYGDDIEEGKLGKDAADMKYQMTLQGIDKDEAAKNAAAAREKTERARKIEDMKSLDMNDFDRRRMELKRRLEDENAEHAADYDYKLAAAQNFKGNMAKLDAEEAAAKKKKQAEDLDADMNAGKYGGKDSFAYGFQQSIDSFTNWSQKMLEMGQKTATGLHQAFSDTFFSAFNGEINNISDLWHRLVTDMKNMFVRAMSDMLATAIMTQIKIAVTGMLGGGEDGGGMSAGLKGLGGGGKDKGSSIVAGIASILSASPTGFALGGIIPGAMHNIQKFANGGIIAKPTYLVGEGRYPEAVIPMLDGKNVGVRFMGRGGAGGGQTSVTQNRYEINIHAIDAKSIQDLFATHGAPMAAAIAQNAVSQGASNAVIRDVERGHALRRYFTSLLSG